VRLQPYVRRNYCNIVSSCMRTAKVALVHVVPSTYTLNVLWTNTIVIIEFVKEGLFHQYDFNDRSLSVSPLFQAHTSI
jgi:hypothetical protein